MLEIKLNVEVTTKDLSEAITQLAHSLSSIAVISDRGIAVPMTGVESAQGPFPDASDIAGNAPVPQTNVQHEDATQPQAFMNPPEPVSIPTPAPVPAPTASPVPSPVPAPKVDMDMIKRAGASLVDQGKMNDILALLSKYGVQAVNKLDPSQFPAFADDLRALGANI